MDFGEWGRYSLVCVAASSPFVERYLQLSSQPDEPRPVETPVAQDIIEINVVENTTTAIYDPVIEYDGWG